MVAEKTTKLQGNQVTDARCLTLYAKMKFQTKVSKAKRTTNANMYNKRKKSKKDNKRNTPVLEWEFLIVPFPDDCLFYLFMPWSTFSARACVLCDVFKFGLILIDLCFRNKHPYIRYKL